MKTKALTREDRKRQVMLAFAVELQSLRDGQMTVHDIARRLNLAPSTKLRSMVNELVSEGLLHSTDEDMPGVVGKRVIYSPSALFDSRTGKPRHERRVIKFRAKQNGQQSMWEEIVS